MARDLAGSLGLPLVPTDDFYWEPGWRSVPAPIVRERVIAASQAPTLVWESNFDEHRDVLWPLADLIVWLDYPRWIVLLRVIRRNAWWALRAQPVWSGNRMTWRRAVSGVRHLTRSFAPKRSRYPSWLAGSGVRVVRLRSPRAARAFAVALRRATAVAV